MITVKFKKLDSTAIPFSYSRKWDACMDMYCLKDTYLIAGQTYIIPTGIAVEIPSGYEGLVRGRSGLSSKGLIVSLGTIDETYRGDVGIIMTNSSNGNHYFRKGDRLAQFTIKPVSYIRLQETYELTDTERNDNGFGSSGI
jgi:dUTP pyrophosphatase